MHSRARKTVATVLLAAGLSVGAVAVATPASATSTSTSGGDWNRAVDDAYQGRAALESMNDTGRYTNWVVSYPDSNPSNDGYRYYESYRVDSYTSTYQYLGSTYQSVTAPWDDNDYPEYYTP